MKFTLTIEGDSREELTTLAEALALDGKKERVKQQLTQVAEHVGETVKQLADITLDDAKKVELVTGQGREPDTKKTVTVEFGGEGVMNAAQVRELIADQVAVESDDDDGKDSRGFEWDERIHASTRTKNKDGSWKYRRGISDELKASVEAEQQETPATINPAAAFAPPPPPPAPEADAVTFSQVAVKLTNAKKDGLIDQKWVDDTVACFDMDNFGGFARDSERLQKFNSLLDVRIKACENVAQ